MGIDSSCRYNGNLFLVLLRVFPDKGDDALYLVIILRFFEGISRMLRVYAQVCEFFSVKAQMAACQRSLYDYQIRRCLIFSVPQITIADFTEETIGAIFVADPFTYSGRLMGRPAPEIIKSAPAFTAALTYSA